VPCVTLRENTEWVETLEGGWNILVGSSKEKILDGINIFPPDPILNLSKFGDGDASYQIKQIIMQYSRFAFDGFKN